MVSFGNCQASVTKQLINDGFDTCGMLFIEEVSTQAPWHVAQLHRLCQMVNNSHIDNCGGRRSCLTGDLTQLGPVNATSMTQAVMEVCANEQVQL